MGWQSMHEQITLIWYSRNKYRSKHGPCVCDMHSKQVSHVKRSKYRQSGGAQLSFTKQKSCTVMSSDTINIVPYFLLSSWYLCCSISQGMDNSSLRFIKCVCWSILQEIPSRIMTAQAPLVPGITYACIRFISIPFLLLSQPLHFFHITLLSQIIAADKERVTYLTLLGRFS